MTQQTRNDLIAGMDRAAVAELDQKIMDAYLEPFDCKESYEVRAKLNPEFYAVLSTAEYHQHWESIRSASTVTETPKNGLCPRCNGNMIGIGASDPERPSPAILCALVSAVVHAEEFMSPGHHQFDLVAFSQCIDRPEVREWIVAMIKAGFAPVRRDA